ncbi:MAG TPA: hypothetical protein VGG99_19345 [Acetobacteraceae bacterium]
MKWLVDNRSANQRATLDLFVTLTQNESVINSNLVYAQLSQELAGVAFSLWRAVFLSDLTGEIQEQMVDVSAFLGTLISNNSIGYPQDRSAREWTFTYYLSDARFRLQSLASRPPAIIDVSDIEQEAGSAKEDWEIAQRALEKAIHEFAKLTSPTLGHS